MSEITTRGKITDSKGTKLISLDKNVLYCLGREKGETGAGLLIDDIFVSRRHAEIGCDNGFYILDRRSKNGTYVNSRRIHPGEKRFLSDGDVLRLADREYRFSLDQEEEKKPEAESVDSFWRMNETEEDENFFHDGEGNKAEDFYQKKEESTDKRKEPEATSEPVVTSPENDLKEDISDSYADSKSGGEESSGDSVNARESNSDAATPGNAGNSGAAVPGNKGNPGAAAPAETENPCAAAPAEMENPCAAAPAGASTVAETDSEDLDETVTGEEKERGAWGPFVYSLRSSAAGRKLSVETSQKGCVDYQVRMIEENPDLMISEVRHVRKLENDCFLCNIGGRFALKDYLEKEKKKIDGVELVDRILKLVKLGEEYMLDRDRYFLTPSTIFMDKEGSLMLVYIPHMDKKDKCFSRGMAELCSLLAGLYPEQETGLLTMEKLFRDNVCDTREYIKHIYHYKLIDFPPPSTSEKKKRGPIPVKYLITVVSFIAFMAVFWLTDLNYINLAGILLILVGGNILMYNNGRKGVDKNVKGKQVRD